MRNVFVKIILALIALIFIYFYAVWLYRFTSKAYYINETKLYKLDTFYLLGSAYETTSAISSRGKYHELLQFQSQNGYSFSIKANIFLSIKNKKQLEDTLMHDGVAFVSYTTKTYFNRYKSNHYPFYIKVYQIQFGNTKYIDVNKLNSLNKSRLSRKILLPAIVIFCLITILGFKRIRNKIFNAKELPV